MLLILSIMARVLASALLIGVSINTVVSTIQAEAPATPNDANGGGDGTGMTGDGGGMTNSNGSGDTNSNGMTSDDGTVDDMGMGCVEGDACDDGNPCTVEDACTRGACMGMRVADCALCDSDAGCDDDDPCTDDFCDTDGACTWVENEAPCDDGDECTEDDSCSAGVCAGVAIPNCGAPQMFSVAVSVNGPGQVILNPPGGSYAPGDEVTVSAMPMGCATFERFEGDFQSSDEQLTLQVDGDVNVEAVFAAIEPLDLTGEWSILRNVSDVEGGGSCISPANNTSDLLTVDLLDDGETVSFALQFTADDDANGFIDDSPGQIWFESLAGVCPNGQPFVATFDATLDGNDLVAPEQESAVAYCGCTFTTTTTLVTTLEDCDSFGGIMTIQVRRACPQFGTVQCSTTYRVTATRAAK